MRRSDKVFIALFQDKIFYIRRVSHVSQKFTKIEIKQSFLLHYFDSEFKVQAVTAAGSARFLMDLSAGKLLADMFIVNKLHCL